MKRQIGCSLLLRLSLFAYLGAGGAVVVGDDAIEFNRDVRPILAGHCFKCHGPDEQTREAGVRVDLREAAIAESESGTFAIVPGKPDDSELVRRIVSQDPETQMPPAAANKPLTDAQKNTLQAWIAGGANYESHWAFAPPVQAPLPDAKQADWPRNAIDHFVLARQEAAGLRPSAEADRYTLARRLYFDLIGLAPTPEEVDAFVQDASPTAYEALVDRLLASPRYGERWARRWLDLARYADTNGYEKDRVRSIWPYRDWVINALNADMPFDQFTIEQLAGDMLPGATIEQRIATGFHRNTMLNEEGGIDPLEFRYYAIVDRVNTTSTVWLGLTMGCVQCHTHKYDPLPQRDFYRLMAFLNNADEPEMDVPRPEIEQERARIVAEVAAIEGDLANRFPLEEGYRWHDGALVRAASAAGANAEPQPDYSIRISGNDADVDTSTLVLDTNLPSVVALEVEMLTDPQLPQQGPGRAPNGNFVLTELAATVSAVDNPASEQPVKFVAASADFAQDGFPPEQAIDGNAKTGWAIYGKDNWNVARTIVLSLDKPVVSDRPLRWTIRLDQQYGGRHTLGRFRVRFGQAIDDSRPEGERRQEHLDRQFKAWLTQEQTHAVRWTQLQPATAKSTIPSLTVLDDGSIIASGDQSKRDVYEVRVNSELPTITAIRLDCMPDDRLPKRGPGRIAYEGPFGDFFLSELTGRANDGDLKFASASHSFASGNNTALMSIDGDPQTGWSINGGQGRAHSAVFQLAQPLTGASQLDLQLLFERYYAAGLGRFRIWATDDARSVTARDVPNVVEHALLVAEADRTPEQRDLLLNYYLSVAPELAGEREKARKLRESLPAFPTTLVMQERPAEHPRSTRVHKRGEFLQETDRVEAELPGMFSPLAADEPHNRLAFARWLASDRNPLVARVTVNRHWATIFGRGMVRTTEDFGYQGEPPTHPELLDWLAVQFMRDGWSTKKLHRLIVTSATYRQSSLLKPGDLERDPQNKLLARAPRMRLEAELVRDVALRISGLLTDKIGGPSVFPPQPAGVATEGAYGPLDWKLSEGPDRYRRGLYTFTKRTAPYAMFLTFDASSGEACLARREVSNTPLQALTLLNDTVFVEAAQVLGRQTAAENLDPNAGVERLYRRCVGRPAKASEREALVAFHQAHRERLSHGKLDAALIAGGSDADPISRAAWTLTARAILNLDETITKE